MARAVGPEAVAAEAERPELRVGAQHRRHRAGAPQPEAALLQLQEAQPAVGREGRGDHLGARVADRGAAEAQLHQGGATEVVFSEQAISIERPARQQRPLPTD